MPLHIIEFYDAYGRVTLAEFLRLAGLLAAGAADLDDLAIEFSRHEVTLLLPPQRIADADAASWYDQSFAGYRARLSYYDARTPEDCERLEAESVGAYRGMFEHAVTALLGWADEARVGTDHLAPVIPLPIPAGGPE